MAEEEDFSVLLKAWGDAIDKKFGQSASTQCTEVLEDLFESKEDVAADLEVEQWDESAIMDTLHSEKSAYSDPEICKTFFKIFKAVVDGKYNSMLGDVVLLPEDIQWDCDEKDIKEAQLYMNEQCPGGGFSTAAENKNLFKTIAVGRKNQIELLSIIMDIYELAHVQEMRDPNRGFKNETDWAAKCKFFRDNKKQGEVLRRAIPEFKKRISGGGPHEMIMNPIEDDINVYIEYVLIMNNVITNLVKAHDKDVCPLQVDFVIVGRKHGETESKDADDDKGDDDDDDDDGDASDILNRLTAGCYDSGNVPLINALPDGGFCGVLKTQKIEFDVDSVSLEDVARTTRAIQEKITAKIGKANAQRIIVCIDREEGGNEDKLIVYQLDNDAINVDYNEMHLSWKTKNSLLPNYKTEHEELAELAGGSLDIGDKGFVFSFHVHSKDRMKCDVWIKAQQLPFLPYHLVELWPMYFHGNFKTIDKKYSLKYIYEQCTAQTDDPRLMKWLETIDPMLYATLKQKHLKYN